MVNGPQSAHPLKEGGQKGKEGGLKRETGTPRSTYVEQEEKSQLKPGSREETTVNGVSMNKRDLSQGRRRKKKKEKAVHTLPPAY